jgi:hypothetical protein
VKESLLAEFRWTDDSAAAQASGIGSGHYDVEYNFVLSRAAG